MREVGRLERPGPAAAHGLIVAGRRFRVGGDLAAAVAEFTQAHQLHPTSARPLIERGALLILQGRYEQTSADYRRAEALDPHYRGLASYFAELYLYTGRAGEALAESEAAAVGEPNNLMHRINIAHAHLPLGDTAAFTTCREVAEQRHPTKKRSGRELALQDFGMVDDTGVVATQGLRSSIELS